MTYKEAFEELVKMADEEWAEYVKGDPDALPLMVSLELEMTRYGSGTREAKVYARVGDHSVEGLSFESVVSVMRARFSLGVLVEGWIEELGATTFPEEEGER